MSECKHGYYCKDGTPCALCHEDELAALRAKLQEAVGIALKFAEAARDACIAGLAQSSKMRQYEDRISELEAERDQFRARSFQLEGCLNPEYIPPWLDPESMVALLGEGEAK